MFLYEVQRLLSNIYVDNDFRDEICKTQIDYIRRLLVLREHPELVASDLIYASIEIINVESGEEGLLQHAEYLRSMATTIERRVKRHKFRPVPKATEPVNENKD